MEYVPVNVSAISHGLLVSLYICLFLRRIL